MVADSGAVAAFLLAREFIFGIELGRGDEPRDETEWRAAELSRWAGADVPLAAIS